MATDQEIIACAEHAVDLPAFFGAYGWRAVDGADSEDQRVIAHPTTGTRVVVSRDSDNGRWHWWDAITRCIGTIVEAIIELLGVRAWGDVIAILRRTLIDPPTPPPMVTTENTLLETKPVASQTTASVEESPSPRDRVDVSKVSAKTIDAQDAVEEAVEASLPSPQRAVAHFGVSDAVATAPERRPFGSHGRSRLAEKFSLDLSAIGAFARSFEEDEHGNIIFPHGRQGDAEVYGRGDYSFRGVEETGPGRGRSIWFGHPSGRQPTTLIMVAPSASAALAAWQALGDPHAQAHAVLVSTAGVITQTGLDRLTKLIHTVHGTQSVRGHADLVSVVDLTGTGGDEQSGQSDTLGRLAETLGVKYLRVTPPQKTTWNELPGSTQTDEGRLAASAGSPAAAVEEDPTLLNLNHAESKDAQVDVHEENQDDGKDRGGQQSGSEKLSPRR